MVFDDKFCKDNCFFAKNIVHFDGKYKKRKKVKRSELIREILEDYAKHYKLNQIRQAALKMRKEYQSNEELKSFHSLDSEDFLE